ncbi:MAG: hypothetical protein ABUK08_00420 [Candidatus Humimicrobiaceae bacterium]
MSDSLRKFELGKYEKNSICDSNSIAKYEIVRRTEKSVWVKQWNGVIERKGISIYDNAESIYPDGKYSFCRILRPEDRVEEVVETPEPKVDIVKEETVKVYPELKAVLTKEEEVLKELIERAEKMYPMSLYKQFNIVRKYLPGPTFNRFCKFKNLTGDYKEALKKQIIRSL